MSFKEQRRFPRVRVGSASNETLSTLRAQVTWPNLETSTLTDLSYGGLAVRRPGVFSLAAATRTEVAVRLGRGPVFRVPVRVAWHSLDLAGLEFTELPAEGHQAMADFADLKLIGASLKSVGPQHFSTQDFNQWFQAPGCSLFVWNDDLGRIHRAQIDLKDRTYALTRGDLVTPAQMPGLLVLSGLEQRPVEDFVHTLHEA